MQYDMELQWRPETKRQYGNALSRSHGNRTRGATIDDFSPDETTTKGTYRGPQGPVLDGTPLSLQLGIEDITNNYALSLTVLAAVTFIPDLPPVDTNPDGYRSRAHSLDSMPILSKAVVIGCGGGVAFGHWMIFSNSQVSPTTIREHGNAPARTVWQPMHRLNELVREI